MRSMRFKESGFSLVDMMMVLGIMGALGGMAVIQIARAVPAAKADGAMRVIISQLSSARELAIQQRRYMQVGFIAPNAIRIIRTDVNTNGVTIGTTVLSTVELEGGITYNVISGIPDTPEHFGMTTATDFGTATTIQFSTDGTLIDQTGAPLNGTIVLASPNVKNSSRAVTVFGSTGRIRGYRWDGNAWVLV